MANNTSVKKMKVSVFKNNDTANSILQYLLLFVLIVLLVYACYYAYSVTIKQNKTEKYTDLKKEVVLLHSHRCYHCKQFIGANKFEQAKSKFGQYATFKMVEVNEPAAQQYSGMTTGGVPAVVVLLNGKKQASIVGNVSTEKFNSFLESHLM